MEVPFLKSGRFWLSLVVTSIIFSICAHWLEISLKHRAFLRLLRQPYVKVGIVLILWFVILFGWKRFKEGLRKQFSRKHPSWLVYLYGGVFLYPLTAELGRIMVWKPWFYFDFFSLVRPLVGTFLYLAAYSFWGREIYDFRVGQFSPGAAGLQDDRLDFSLSAKLSADRISKLTEPVNVVALYGDMGSGKSSYTRMIIESLEAEEALYTYISLTETNEASDFSKLFAERWTNTIKSRYPKLLTSERSAKSLLQDILRETKNGGWITHLISLIPDLGVFRTKLKTHDRYFKPDDDFVDDDVASYFAHIGEFTENKWVIVIDEIERGKLSEVHRAIEVIERMKYLGRRGLPLRLIFILNVSRSDLQSRLSGSPTDQHAALIDGFLFQNPKNITLNLFVPPLPIEKWINYIAEPLLELFNEYNFADHEHQIALLTSTHLLIPEAGKSTMRLAGLNEFPKEHDQAYAYLFTKYFLKEDPRVMLRVIDQARFLINGFVYIDNAKVNTGSIRFTDLLALAYVQVKYPAIIEYFGKTVGFYAGYDRPFETKPPESALLNSIMLAERMDHKSANDAQKQRFNGTTLPPEDRLYDNFIKSTLAGGAYSKALVIDLIALVAHFYLDEYRINDWSSRGDNFLNYYYTTSNPRNLRDALRSFVGDKTQDDIDVSHYRQHQTNPAHPLDIKDTDELISYSHFYRNRVSSRSTQNHFKLAEAIYNAINNKKIPTNPSASVYTTTQMEQATSEFTFNIMEAVLLTSKEEEYGKAVNFISTALNNQSLSLDFKLRVVRSFMHDREGDIHYRLKDAFERMSKDKANAELLRVGIKKFIEEMRTRYQNSSEIIYDREESPIYVLYQSWSGDPSNKEEIEKIRDVAQRGLIDHPEAIVRYWSQYRYDPAWSDLGDAMDALEAEGAGALLGGTNPSLTIDTRTLAIITEESSVDELTKQKARFWSGIQTHLQKIVKDDETLMAVLARHPFLTSNSEGQNSDTATNTG